MLNVQKLKSGIALLILSLLCFRCDNAIYNIEPFEDRFDRKTFRPQPISFSMPIKDVGDLLFIQSAISNRLDEDSLICTNIILRNIITGGLDNVRLALSIFSDETRSFDNLLYFQPFIEQSLEEKDKSDTSFISKSLPFIASENVEINVLTIDKSFHFASALYEGFLNVSIQDSLIESGRVSATVDKDGFFNAVYSKSSDFRVLQGNITLDSLFIGRAIGRDDGILNIYNNRGTLKLSNDTLSLSLLVANDSRNETLNLTLIEKQ